MVVSLYLIGSVLEDELSKSHKENGTVKNKNNFFSFVFILFLFFRNKISSFLCLIKRDRDQ